MKGTHASSGIYSMSELCQVRKHNDAGRNSIPMHYITRKEAKLIVIGRSTDLPACQSVDKFGLPTIRYKVFCYRNCNKVIRSYGILHNMIRRLSMRLCSNVIQAFL